MRTTKRAVRRSQRAKRALKHAARLSPAQLAALLCDRTRHRPERLAALSSQLARLADVRQQLRDTRRELRQLRAAPAPAGATVATTVSATPATHAPPAPVDLLPPADSHAYARIIMCLHTADWPVEWTDLLHASHTPPARVAEALLLAMRRVQ